jgi:predicted glutamine amidotransferase
MCRWLCWWGEPIYLERLLFEPTHSLVHQSLQARKALMAAQGDGFGLGWYGERETPGLYREILPAWNDRNLRSLAHQLRARLFFAHVRASTGTDTARSNCHPFAHGKWLFMHNGQIGGYERLRRRLETLIPDALYNARQGTNDSELIFFLLFRHGLADDPARALRATIAELRAEMAAAGVEEPLRLTAALTDGTRVIAVRYASDAEPPSLFWRAGRDGLTIVSEPLDAERDQWNRVPPDHLLLAEETRIAAIEPIAA